MDRHGNIYIHEYHEKEVVHHSSIAGGNESSAASVFKVENGKISEINERSGHYGPNQEVGNNIMVEIELKMQGVDVTKKQGRALYRA